MKNYLYKFKIDTGFFDRICYDQIQANNEKEALFNVVNSFKHEFEDITKEDLECVLGENWTVSDFWKTMDTRFCSQDNSVIYKLYWLKEIQFNLSKI